VVGCFLGLDVGDRRIGVAVSDPDGSFALPLRSLDGRQRPAAFEAILNLAQDYQAEAVVVGLPLSLSGGDSAQTEAVRDFAADLEQRLGLPVHLWDERLSTQEAMRRVADTPARGRGRRGKPSGADTDAIAASIILQAYLDRRRAAAPDSGLTPMSVNQEP
jgi:putative Holliday junction resolvase